MHSMEYNLYLSISVLYRMFQPRSIFVHVYFINLYSYFQCHLNISHKLGDVYEPKMRLIDPIIVRLLLGHGSNVRGGGVSLMHKKFFFFFAKTII